MRIQFRQLLPISVLLLTFIAGDASAQQNLIKGTVIDTAENKKLHFAIVALIDLTDTSLYRSVRSDASGNFKIEKIPVGKYTLMVSYPKMADFLQDLVITDTSQIDLQRISMTPHSVLLQEVIVNSGRAIRMRGDTLEYVADSFATRPNANVEELLKRLPGIYVERNGTIYAQGKKVERVLVDGDEFFAEDPGLASKFLRADAIETVQVYDARSEQADFTGIDDGVRAKTINLKLKENKKKGAFGKASAGANDDDFYRYELMAAHFNGSRKISAFGLALRLTNEASYYNGLGSYVEQDYEAIEDNTQNMFLLSYEDFDGTATGPVPTVIDGGAHYSDKWKANKQKVYFNYRLRDSKASNWSRSSSFQVLPDGSSFASRQSSNSQDSRFSQRVNGRFSTQLDSFSNLQISIDGKRGHGTSLSSTASSSVNEKGFLVNNNVSDQTSDRHSQALGTNIRYRRSFRKRGRTLTVLIQQNTANSEGNNHNFSLTDYYDPETGGFNRIDTLNQLQQTRHSKNSYAGKAVLTEPLSKDIQLSIEYGWKRSAASRFLGTYNNKQNSIGSKVDSLSNDYMFVATTHIAAANIAFNREEFFLTIGGNAFISKFHQEDKDRNLFSRRNFINWSPRINGTVKLRNNRQMSFGYSGNTRQPSVNELQPTFQTHNNLYVQLGNPDLKPSFSHNANLYFSQLLMRKMSQWNADIGFYYQQNSIVNKSYIDAQGRNVSQYVNIDGLPSINGQFGISFQNKAQTLQYGVSVDASHAGEYNFQNNVRVKNSYWGSGLRARVKYEFKDVLEIAYIGSINATFAKTNVEDRSNKVITYTHSLQNSFFLPSQISVKSVCRFNFQPANSSFANSLNYITWNASVDKSIFKNKSLLLKFEVNDILNQNRGFMRFARGSATYEGESYVVKRFWLLSAAWNFSGNFK